MQELNRRNTETVESVLKDVFSKLENLNEKIDSFNNSISTLSTRQSNLEMMVYQMKIGLNGNKASEV